MKKTYIIPEALIVELGAMQMMAESAPNTGVDTSDGGATDPNYFDVKESKTVWDEEW